MARIKVIVFWLVKLSVIGLFAASSLAEFDRVSIWFELLSHFRFQYLVMALVCFCLALLGRSVLYAVLSLLVFLHSSFLVLPWYFSNTESRAADKGELRILQSNVYTGNTKRQEFLHYVNASSADIISVQEVNSDWAATLEQLREKYPFIVLSPREDNFGIALLSKIPLDEQDIIQFGESGIPSIKVSLSLGGRRITLISVHTLPPIGEAYFNVRNAQLRDLATRVSDLGNPVVVIGDLNTSMWSSYYQSFVESAGLTNTRYGVGVLPTWPTHMPFLKIPIDHVLVSQDFVIKKVEVGRDIGSDHYPYLASVILK